MTNAEQFFSNSEVRGLVDKLVDKLKIEQETIKSVRAPQAEKKESYKKYLESLQTLREREKLKN
jgi:hypothetical protein